MAFKLYVNVADEKKVSGFLLDSVNGPD